MQKIALAAADKKAENIVLLDVRGMASFTDYLVIASGSSDRQVRAIGEHIEDSIAAAHGPRLVGREGYEQGQWALVDFGEVVVHLFSEDYRHAFSLEQLWSDAPRVIFDPRAPGKPLEFVRVEHEVARVAVGGRHARR